MLKKFIATTLCLATIACSFQANTVKVDAAQRFWGDYWGNGFDYHEDWKMEIADGWSNGGMFDCTWTRNNVQFNNGIMNLSILKDWNNNRYTGGEYRTRETFGYGMYDVRMKPAKNDGIVSSFFTYTGPSDGTRWDEIDIEFLGKNTRQVQFNYFTDGRGNHEHVHDLGFDASQDFHQYGFLWLPWSITWYVDTKPVYTAWNDIPSVPGKIMMNIWNGRGVDSWLNRYNGVAPLTAQYDWCSYTKVNY